MKFQSSTYRTIENSAFIVASSNWSSNTSKRTKETLDHWKKKINELDMVVTQEYFYGDRVHYYEKLIELGQECMFSQISTICHAGKLNTLNERALDCNNF